MGLVVLVVITMLFNSNQQKQKNSLELNQEEKNKENLTNNPIKNYNDHFLI